MNPFKCVSSLTTFGNSDVPDGLTDEMYEEWMCGCDNCQDACPYNMRHDWSQGKVLKELEDIASMIMPDNYGSLTDEFLIRNVIPKTANHLQDKMKTVFLHGLGQTAHDWRKVIDQASLADYDCPELIALSGEELK